MRLFFHTYYFRDFKRFTFLHATYFCLFVVFRFLWLFTKYTFDTTQLQLALLSVNEQENFSSLNVYTVIGGTRWMRKCTFSFSSVCLIKYYKCSGNDGCQGSNNFWQMPILAVRHANLHQLRYSLIILINNISNNFEFFCSSSQPCRCLVVS